MEILPHSGRWEVSSTTCNCKDPAYDHTGWCARCSKWMHESLRPDDEPTPPTAYGDPGPWCMKCASQPCVCPKPEADAVRSWLLGFDEQGELQGDEHSLTSMDGLEQVHVVERSAYERVVAERDHWKANHDNVVEKKRRLSARSAKLLSALKKIAECQHYEPWAPGDCPSEEAIIASDALKEWEGK